MADAIEFSIARAGSVVIVTGDCRTPADREALKDTIALALEDVSIERSVIVDVSRAGYLDGSGLVSLVTAARKCADAGVTLKLEGANEDLRELLRITKIDQVLTVVTARATKAAP